MSVGPYALTSVDEVVAQMGSPAQKDGLSVYCSATDATAATVEVTPTTMILTITGGAHAGVETLTFGDADMNTMGELVAGINALSGWKARLLYHASADSDNLIEMGPVACLGAACELSLKLEDIYFIERLIDRATAFIEHYCNRLFLSRDYSREVYRPKDGDEYLELDEYPVTQVQRVSFSRAFCLEYFVSCDNYASIEVTPTDIRVVIDGAAPVIKTFAAYPTVGAMVTALGAISGSTCNILGQVWSPRYSTDILVRPAMACGFTLAKKYIAFVEIPNWDLTWYHLVKPTEDRNAGLLYAAGGFPSGQEVFVDYTAGYTSIPPALEDACIRLVIYRYQQAQKDSAVTQERLGDYSYNIKEIKTVLPPDIMADLDLYRRIII